MNFRDKWNFLSYIFLVNLCYQMLCIHSTSSNLQLLSTLPYITKYKSYFQINCMQQASEPLLLIEPDTSVTKWLCFHPTMPFRLRLHVMCSAYFQILVRGHYILRKDTRMCTAVLTAMEKVLIYLHFRAQFGTSGCYDIISGFWHE